MKKLLAVAVAVMVSASVLAVASLGLMVLGTGTASGQAYPNKAIRLICGAAGGGADFNAREVAQALGPLGQAVLVDNRPPILVGELGAKAAPDGYTLTIQGASLWIGPLLQKATYDVERDFAPVSLISREIMMLTVHPSLPVKSVNELLTLAKARPGELTFATGRAGSPSMLGMELLKSMTNVNMLVVPYKSTIQLVTAVVAGESQLTIGDLGLIVPHTKSGRLRTLAVTSLDPSLLAPGIPTVAASGVPGFEVTGVTAIVAPAKTPPAIINRVNQEIVRHFNRAEVKERFLGNVMEVVATSPEQLAVILKSDLAKWGKVFRDAGIKVE